MGTYTIIFLHSFCNSNFFYKWLPYLVMYLIIPKQKKTYNYFINILHTLFTNESISKQLIRKTQSLWNILTFHDSPIVLARQDSGGPQLYFNIVITVFWLSWQKISKSILMSSSPPSWHPVHICRHHTVHSNSLSDNDCATSLHLTTQRSSCHNCHCLCHTW